MDSSCNSVAYRIALSQRFSAPLPTTVVGVLVVRLLMENAQGWAVGLKNRVNVDRTDGSGPLLQRRSLTPCPFAHECATRHNFRFVGSTAKLTIDDVDVPHLWFSAVVRRKVEPGSNLYNRRNRWLGGAFLHRPAHPAPTWRRQPCATNRRPRPPDRRQLSCRRSVCLALPMP